MGPPESELERLAARFPARAVRVQDDAFVSIRECGEGPAVVCLHGIGSGSASWLDVAVRLAARARVIAWDAPGYGDSTPLRSDAPKAADYAARLDQILDAIGIQQCVLVGHSLGALAAAAASVPAAGRSHRIAQLVLISPARGYAARPQQAADVRSARLEALATLGIAGMARHRSGRMVSEGATELARQWVRWNMARLHAGGYRQAVELLCGDDLLDSLPPAVPVRVLCGDSDTITPPAACAEIAQACGVELEYLAGAGHASHIEQPDAVAAVLADALRSAAAPSHPSFTSQQDETRPCP